MAEGAKREVLLRKIETRPPLTRRRMSRRQFIGGSAKRVVALAVGTGTASAAVRNYFHKPYLGEKKEEGQAEFSIQPVSKGEIAEPASEAAIESRSLFDAVFHDLSDRERQWVRSLVDSYKRIIKSKEEYPAMLSVTEKYEKHIRAQCSQRGILPQSGIGIVFVENGGGEDEINEESDARGVAQFLEETARENGLLVDANWREGGFDERADPVKSIEAMSSYLQVRKELFAGDEGLSIWSYHAGTGNVMAALQAYFWDVRGIDIGSYGVAIANKDSVEVARIEKEVGELIVEFKTDVHKVLANQTVQEIIVPYLENFSQTYPYQVVAVAELFEEETKI